MRLLRSLRRTGIGFVQWSDITPSSAGPPYRDHDSYEAVASSRFSALTSERCAVRSSSTPAVQSSVCLLYRTKPTSPCFSADIPYSVAKALTCRTPPAAASASNFRTPPVLEVQFMVVSVEASWRHMPCHQAFRDKTRPIPRCRPEHETRIDTSIPPENLPHWPFTPRRL